MEEPPHWKDGGLAAGGVKGWLWVVMLAPVKAWLGFQAGARLGGLALEKPKPLPVAEGGLKLEVPWDHWELAGLGSLGRVNLSCPRSGELYAGSTPEEDGRVMMFAAGIAGDIVETPKLWFAGSSDEVWRSNEDDIPRTLAKREAEREGSMVWRARVEDGEVETRWGRGKAESSAEEEEKEDWGMEDSRALVGRGNSEAGGEWVYV